VIQPKEPSSRHISYSSFAPGFPAVSNYTERDAERTVECDQEFQKLVDGLLKNHLMSNHTQIHPSKKNERETRKNESGCNSVSSVIRVHGPCSWWHFFAAFRQIEEN